MSKVTTGSGNVFADLGLDPKLELVAEVLSACGVNVKGKDQKHPDMAAGLVVIQRLMDAASAEMRERCEEALNKCLPDPSAKRVLISRYTAISLIRALPLAKGSE